MKTRFFCLLFAIAQHSASACELKLEQAWVREAPPGSQAMAAYAVLRNPGDAPIDLIAISSPQFGRVEMHSMRMEEGVMKMRPLNQVTIPAGGVAELRGEQHLMLLKPKKKLRAGARIALELHLSCGASQTEQVPVATEAPPAPVARAAPDHPK